MLDLSLPMLGACQTRIETGIVHACLQEVKRVLQWHLALLELCAGGPLSAAPHDAEHLAALHALPQAAALLQPQAVAAARSDGTDTVGVLACSVRALCEGLVSSAGLDVR